jgi:hypothetical protein
LSRLRRFIYESVMRQAAAVRVDGARVLTAIDSMINAFRLVGDEMRQLTLTILRR